ncbi:DUF1834 family protein [Salmonella enterica subsp. enterica serovar Worthington]|nr:DUF1834 family protein [Salmonella enterica subsp. enterica serovar Worthington]
MLEETEAALLARVRELFGATLRQVEPLTGTWTNEDVHRLFLAPPSVFLAWMGCGEGVRVGKLKVAGHFCRGGVAEREPVNRPGIYQIVERLIAGVNGQTFGPTTGMRLTQVRNLCDDNRINAGVVLYGVLFSGTTPLPSVVDMDSLDDYERHWQTEIPGRNPGICRTYQCESGKGS